MAISRSLGWTLLTTRSPIEIVPEVMFSSPASIRNKVDLPQPEGPTSTTKAPSSIGIDTPCSTSKPPNDFRTSRICTDDINTLPNAPVASGECRSLLFICLGLIRLFWRCRWIKVVGVRPSQFTSGVHFRVQLDRERCEARGDMQTLEAHTKMTHKNKACALRETP